MLQIQRHFSPYRSGGSKYRRFDDDVQRVNEGGFAALQLMLTAVIQFIYSAHTISTAPITSKYPHSHSRVQRTGKIERELRDQVVLVRLLFQSPYRTLKCCHVTVHIYEGRCEGAS